MMRRGSGATALLMLLYLPVVAHAQSRGIQDGGKPPLSPRERPVPSNHRRGALAPVTVDTTPTLRERFDEIDSRIDHRAASDPVARGRQGAARGVAGWSRAGRIRGPTSHGPEYRFSRWLSSSLSRTRRSESEPATPKRRQCTSIRNGSDETTNDSPFRS